MKNILFFMLTILCFVSCDPQIDDAIELPPAPETASFSIMPGSAPNRYLLTNTTSEVFQYQWDFGNGQSAVGESVEAFYQEAGEYEITLTVLAAGGSVSSSQILTVEEDAPFECAGNTLYEFLSNCDEKTWRLTTEDGALWVGPDDGSATWFASSQNDIDERPCQWNDTWTFTGNSKMVYETQGDIWAEDYMGFDFECIDETMLSDQFAPWAAGTHDYLLTEDVISTLTISGLGAFIGLPKVANGAEVTTPQSSITYDITKMESGANGDLLELEVNFGPGIWRFTLVSN